MDRNKVVAFCGLIVAAALIGLVGTAAITWLTNIDVTKNNSIENSDEGSQDFRYSSKAEPKSVYYELIYADLLKKETFDEEKSFQVKNMYKMLPYFSDYKSYYIAKVKMTNIFENVLTELYDDNKKASESELEAYYNINKTALSKTLGIESKEHFITLMKNMNSVYTGKYTDFILNPAFTYNDKENQAIYIFITLGSGVSNDGPDATITCRPLHSTDTQSAPYISLSNIDYSL